MGKKTAGRRKGENVRKIVCGKENEKERRRNSGMGKENEEKRKLVNRREDFMGKEGKREKECK